MSAFRLLSVAFRPSSLVLRLFLLVVCAFALAGRAVATPSVSVSTGFTAADGVRTYVDVGGVWNGTSEVTTTTGDTFTITWTNTGDSPAYSFTPSITLPSHFNYVANTAQLSDSVSTPGLGVVATQAGAQLTFSILPGAYDLAPNTSLTLTYGVTLATTANNASVDIGYRHVYDVLTNGVLQPFNGLVNQRVVVRAGDSTLTVTPSQQNRAVGQLAEFTVTVTNSGFGGLFDVVIDESFIKSAINPSNPATRLELQGPVVAGPGNPYAHTDNGTGDIFTIPYLAPGQTFRLIVLAEVLDCERLLNRAVTTDRTGRTQTTTEASVAVDLTQPLVSYVAPPITLVYNDWTAVSIPITNDAAAGDARSFVLHTTIDLARYDVNVTSPGWSVAADAGNAVFTYTSGTIAQGATATLGFDIRLKPAVVCSDNGAASVFYEARYTNACGAPYAIPKLFGSINPAIGTPTLTLAKTIVEGVDRIAIRDGATYRLTLSATNINNIAEDPLVVTDTVPDGVVFAQANVTASVGTLGFAGQVITWTVPKASLVVPVTLEIPFVVDDADPCIAGTVLTNIAAVQAQSSVGCSLNTSAQAFFFVSNNPGLIAQQYFDTAPAVGAFEAGLASGDLVRDVGEGQQIPFVATYAFGDEYPGRWAGATPSESSTYRDDFGGIAGQTLVPGSLTYTFNGSAPSPILPQYVTLNPGGQPGFEIDFSFLYAGGDVSVENTTLRIDYKTTVSEAALAGGSEMRILQRNQLTLAGGGTGIGACNQSSQTRFTQGAYYILRRAAAMIGISEIPSQIEVCGPEYVTITVGNLHPEHIRRALVTLDLGTRFIRDTTFAPVFGGAFTGNISFTAPANADDDLVFTYTGDAPGDTFANPLPSSGTIRLRVIRKVVDGETTPTNAGFSARVDYDSWQSATDLSERSFNAIASYAPSLVRRANLALTVTPGTLAVTGTQIRYLIYLSNTDAGIARNARLETTLPVGFNVNVAATDAANGTAVTANGQILTWAFGDLPSGGARVITVIADVGAVPDCEVPSPGDIVASWGCENLDGGQYLTAKTPPAYFFPQGKMQVLHLNEINSNFATLCEDGKISLLVRNTGSNVVRDVRVTEIISGAGMAYKAGSATVGGVAVSDPLIAATAHTWTSAQIPALSEMLPGTEIRIDFEIATDEAIAGTSPVLSVSVTAKSLCGRDADSLGQNNFPLELRQPIIVVEKTGRNVTAGQTAFVGTVYGGNSDTIEWRIVVRNNGVAEAEHLRLSDQLSGTGGTATIHSVGTAPATGGADPLFGAAQPISPDGVVSLTPLAGGATRVYIITEVLGASCSSARSTPVASVSWGCSNPNATAHSNVGLDPLLPSPFRPTHSARLVLEPSIDSDGAYLNHDIEHLPGGRARIMVEMINLGGNARHLVFTNTFPNANMVLDTTEPAVVVHDRAPGGISPYPGSPDKPVTTVTWSDTATTAPKFALGNADHVIRYGDRVRLSYHVRLGSPLFDPGMASAFPALGASEPNDGALDVNPPTGWTNEIILSYENSCEAARSASDEKTFPFRLPDLDVVTRPSNSVVEPLSNAVIRDFVIRNEGQAESIADNISVVVRVGRGWSLGSLTLSAPGLAGPALPAPVADGGDNLYTFTLPGTFSLQRPTGSNSPELTVRLSASPADNHLPLTYEVEVYGEARPQSQASTGGYLTGDYYSKDRAASRVIGVALTKDIHSTSESGSSDSLPETATVLIGEEVTYRIGFRLFGSQGGADITDIVFRDTHGDTNNSAHLGLGFVGHANSSGLIPANVEMPVPAVGVPSNIGAARVSFEFGTLSANDVGAGNASFTTDFTVRVLNVETNTEGKSLRNNLGLQFTYQGAVFHSTNSADDGFSGETALAALQKWRDITVRRPQLTLSKQVRNRGSDGSATPAFTNFIGGAQAGDIIEYRLVVTNPGPSAVPLYSLVITDPVPAVVELSDVSGHFGGNATDAAVLIDENALPAAIAGNTITFSAATFGPGDVRDSLLSLPAGGAVTLLYRGRLAYSVHPSANISSSAEAIGYSVPVSGDPLVVTAQSTPQGTADTPVGALKLDDTASASLTILPIDQNKTIIETSVQGNVSGIALGPVVIGEQIRYRITLRLPQGTVPDLVVTDTLDVGLVFIGTPVVQIGDSISDNAIPVVGLLSEAGRKIEWSFGERVTEGVNDTIVITYLAQVENIGSNDAGDILQNRAVYTFTGLPQDEDNIGNVAVTIAEPSITIAKSVVASPDNDIQAGHILTYTVKIDNATGLNVSTAFDLNLVDELPLGVTYEEDSISLPALGNPQITGNANDGWVLTWGRERTDVATNHDLAPGGTLEFTYQVRVDTTSRPGQIYENEITVDWTSTDGAPGPDLGVALAVPGQPLGERIGIDGGGTFNDYIGGDDTTVIAADLTVIAKAKSGDTLPRTATDGAPAPADATGFRIGDLVTYTLTVGVQKGTLVDFKITDTLPAGLAFVETVSITPAAGADLGLEYAYTDPLATPGDAPVADATGALIWDFGTLVRAGVSTVDELVVTYTARVMNDAVNTVPAASPVSTDFTRTNSVKVGYLLSNGDEKESAPATAVIAVQQPRLTLVRSLTEPVGPCNAHVLMRGETGRFRLTVSNTGTAPAYNVLLDEVLPAGLTLGGGPPTQLVLNRTINGVDGVAITLADLAAHTWTGSGLSIALTDAQPLLPGKTLVLEYAFTVDADAPKGATLEVVGAVDEYHSLPSAAPGGHRREYDAVDVDDSAIIVGMEVKGFVYNDIEPNGHRDGFENWNAGPLVYVSLVTTDNIVCRTVAVPASGTGDYLINRIAPGGYRLVVTHAALALGSQYTSPAGAAPAGWLFRIPVNGARPVTFGVVDLLEENFGLYQGTGAITGTVFRDNGQGGGTANNGQRESAESGIAGVIVRLLDGNGAELGTATTDGGGSFALYVPASVSLGDTLIIEEVNPSGHVSTGATTPIGTYDRATDRISFTYDPVGLLSGFAFGDVPLNVFLTDGAQNILPGATAFYRHTFVAGTGGVVSFTVADGAASSVNQPWSAMVLSDSTCGGTPGLPLSAPVTVVAGEEVCIIVKVTAPLGAPYGSVHHAIVTANFAYGGALPPGGLTRQDVTTVGVAASAGLQLTKSVNKTSARPGDDITYTISFTNVGADVLTGLFIHDMTPAYTTFESADSVGGLPGLPNSLTGYAITGPNGGSSNGAALLGAPSTGGSGGIRWEFTGELVPGGVGSVTFTVRVNP